MVRFSLSRAEELPDPGLEGGKASWIKGQLTPAGGLARPCGDSVMGGWVVEAKPTSRGWGGAGSGRTLLGPGQL